MTVNSPDSVDKIITTYFACITAEEFEYKGKMYRPKPLKVMPNIVRGLRCPKNCGGCCPKFTLDYLMTDVSPLDVAMPRSIRFNKRDVIIKSDLQTHNDTRWCRHLRMRDGKCTIHGKHPFSCRFETLRFKQFEDPGRPNYFGNYPFGRAWAFKRTDGGQGARCIPSRVTAATITETLSKLNQLRRWAEHFGLRTKIHSIYKNVELAFGHKFKEPFII